MTEKRYMPYYEEVLDTWFGYDGINEPTEWEIREKDYLVIGECKTTDDADNVCKRLNELQKEKEELKQFKSKVLELLDEKIKHYEHKPFSAPVGQPMSVNFDADVDRIARLSELQDLKKELEND